MAAAFEGTDPQERLARALSLKNDGQYDGAVAEFKGILAADPKHAEAHMHLGLVYGFIGQFTDSAEELKLAIECRAGYLDAHLNLAKTHCMLGDYEQAKAEFTRVLELQPDNTEAAKQLSFLAECGL